MKYLVMPEGDPAYHLALEQVLFEQCRTEDLLLLWTNAPAVVCGAYQNVYQETSLYRAWKQKVAVLRRDSGGGTVYHDPGNLNYTVIRDSEGGIAYDRMMEDILTALHALGLPAEKGGICDLTLFGKKISGSAQRISKGRVLHHGTLLVQADLERLHAIADRTGRQYVSKAVPSKPAQVLNIGTVRPGTLKDFREALLAAWPGNPEPFPLSPELTEAAERLAAEKYRTWAWNCGRSPAFSVETGGFLGDVPVEIRYEARQGVITDCAFRASGKAWDAGKRLIGEKLEPENIEKCCRDVTDFAELLADLVL